jgi:alpha/beta superfamily hydrolase
VVPPDAVLSWAAQPPPTSHGRRARLQVVAGAGHFFHGKLHELKPLVLDFLRT